MRGGGATVCRRGRISNGKEGARARHRQYIAHSTQGLTAGRTRYTL